jgi:ribosomal protein S18 acetylase RimI-like enzyme
MAAIAPEITRLTSSPAAVLAELIAESERAGVRFLRRLADEWANGTNRFDHPGEALFVARNENHVVAVCGLNVDPHLGDGAVGRLRHLYVLEGYRRHGIGERLVAAVIAAAAGARFRRLRLRTSNAIAARLYERAGFRASGESDASHVLTLR